jgi:hypothetical protein
MSNAFVFRVGTAAIAAALLATSSQKVARAGDYVTFKIWNDTQVAITQLYDKDSRQDVWGINDLQDNPVRPGHYFFIRMEQNSYSHCPNMLHDVKLVFANGAVKLLRKLEVCKYDVHVNRT